MARSNTIFALATPPGASLAALLRVSGDAAPAIAAACGAAPWRRASVPVTLKLPVGPVPCLAWAMPGPGTLTGEDVLELIVPGNAVVIADVEEWLRAQGARDAEPGEFTRRALEAGRMDLSRAEATLGLINAQDEAARRQALDDLRGETGRVVAAITERLRGISARYEMLFDFSEEEHAEPIEHALAQDLKQAVADLRYVVGSASPPPRRDAPVIALFGPPNAGKSSLFNALLGVPRSTVSEHPGTTRDAVRADATFGAHRAEVVDLSGVGTGDADRGRFADVASTHALEADLLLMLESPGDTEARAEFERLCARDPAVRARTLWVFTKSDLGAPQTATDIESCAVSATSGGGLDDLRSKLEARLAEIAIGGVTSVLRRTCREALALLDGIAETDPPEAVAGEIRRALTMLDQALLSDTPGDVLDLIFSRFCIGK